MRKNKRRKPMSEINVVPYIDVTLVLLIIFMITTPMLQTGVDVDLPEAEAANVEQKEGIPPIIISIKADGTYFIDLNGDGSEDRKGCNSARGNQQQSTNCNCGQKESTSIN